SISVYGNAFIWDNPDTSSGKPDPLDNFYAFPHVMVRYGIVDFIDLDMVIQGISYKYKSPGRIDFALKMTIPDREKLKRAGYGLYAKYIYNFVDAFGSVAGYREGGTGFSPEGILREGGSFVIKGLFDFDFITLYSQLPFKYYLNLGYEFSNNRNFNALDEMLIGSGIEIKFFNTDFYVEYNIKSLKNLFNPQRMEKAFKTGSNQNKIFEIYFNENIQYFGIGARMKYDNGMTIQAGALLGTFKECGFESGALTTSERIRTGLTDGFSPFYADWQIIGRVSIPIIFHMTGSEIYRNYLLLKNRKGTKARDIDELLGKGTSEGKKNVEKKVSKEEDEKKRLEEIEKRRNRLRIEESIE
ncbi:MAG: hypothetical protein AB1633_08410, partial [Elusimicrobiota bacterium]